MSSECNETRRLLLRAAVYSVVAAGCGCSLHSRRHEISDSGCLVGDAEFRKIEFANLDESLLANEDKYFDIYRTPLLNASGIDNFDEPFRRRLGHVSRVFGLRPGFGFYDDRSAPNAYATEVRRFRGTDGTIAFGKRLLSQCLDSPNGELSVLTISAHEWAHIMQFNDGWDHHVLAAFPKYCLELHADYLAGFYLSTYHRRASAANIQVVGRTWDQLGTGRFNNPGTHGTGTQRISALESGYLFERRNPDANVVDAAEAGYEGLQRLVQLRG